MNRVTGKVDPATGQAIREVYCDNPACGAKLCENNNYPLIKVKYVCNQCGTVSEG